jgi:prevent-host-death family protein
VGVTVAVDRNSVHCYHRSMDTIPATEFKQKCLALLERVGPEGIVITKHGRPVARLVPVESESSELIGALDGKIRVRGDILATGARWDAES